MFTYYVCIYRAYRYTMVINHFQTAIHPQVANTNRQLARSYRLATLLRRRGDSGAAIYQYYIIVLIIR